MSYRFIPVILTFAIASPLMAQRDAAPVDPSALLEALKKVEEKNQQSTQERLQKAIRDFSSASESNAKAIDLYETAIRAIQFAGQSQQTQAFQEWKKKEEPKLKSPEMQTAARLHLRYLVLSLKAASGTVPRENLVPELLQYCNELQDALSAKPDFVNELLRQELLKKSVADSPFARWAHLNQSLQGLKNWEMSPDKLDGIYEKAILPVWREKKDHAQMMRYWDSRIAREEKAASDSRSDFAIEQFQQITRPSLLWKRSEDLLVIGMPNLAMTEMFNIIKATPSHPSNGAWISQLKKICAPEPASTSGQQ